MKATRVLLTSVMALTLCTFGVSASLAQGDNSTPPPPHQGGPGGGGHGPRKGPPPGVSQADWEKFQKTRREVIESDPALKAQVEAMKTARENHKQGEKPNPADFKAAMEKVKALEEQVQAAILKKDPSLAPVIDALNKQRSERREQHKDGGNAPAPTT